MKTIPPSIATALNSTGGGKSLCRIVRITRKDGAVIRFAEAQSDLPVGGATYTAARGIRMSSVPLILNAARTSVDFEVVAVDDGTLDPDDLRNGVYDSADVMISACLQSNPGAGKVDLFRGQIGEVELTDRGLTTIEVLGLMSKARAIPIEHYIPTCRAFFGDHRCKVDLEPMTISTTITGVNGVSVAVAASPAAHYRLGLLIPKSGKGKGDAFEIRQVSGSVLKMYIPPGGKLAAGDAVDLTPGCDFTLKGKQGCTYWGNLINFRGFPDVPGADALNISFSDWGS